MLRWCPSQMATQRGVELLPHPADLRVRARGRNEAEVFQRYASSMSHLLQCRTGRRTQKVTFSKRADSVEELLVAFLNELLYLNEMRGLVSVRAQARVSRGLRGWTGRFVAYCRRRLAQGREIKAATHHGLRFDRSGDGVSCEVIFDL